MNEFINNLKSKALESGFTYTAGIDTDKIVLDKVFRDICAKNTCRNFGTNHMCPPLVGDADVCISRVNSYSKALIVQRVVQLEDSFDYEGMMDGQKEFSRSINALRESCGNNCLLLGAGPCSICKSCAAQKGEPCVQPDKAVSSMEAHCIDVNKTLVNAGLKYNNGEATVSYVGIILYD